MHALFSKTLYEAILSIVNSTNDDFFFVHLPPRDVHIMKTSSEWHFYDCVIRLQIRYLLANLKKSPSRERRRKRFPK